jgi:mycoredoxin
MTQPITVYSTTWCGHCKRLMRQLDEADIAYEVVDVDENPQLGARIVAKTGGFRTVPTLDVGGDLLVNPSIVQVQQALAN